MSGDGQSQIAVDKAMQTALAHHSAGRLPEAESIYRQILADRPDHARALHMLGVVANQVGRHDAAIELMRQSLRVDPACAEAHSNLSISLAHLDRASEAVAACREAIRLKPGLGDAHCNLGRALVRLGQFEEAVAAHREGVRLMPRSADALTGLGSALKALGRLDDAIAVHRAAIRLSPCLASAHNNLGNALLQQRKLDEAIAALRRATELQPGMAEAHLNLGNALSERGDLAEAAAAYRRAAQLRPNYVEAITNLGSALFLLAQFDEAVAALRRAVELRPGDAEGHSNLGSALMQCGDFDEAVESCARAMAIRPDDARCTSNWAYLLNFHPDYGAAEILAAHRKWDDRHGHPVSASAPAAPQSGRPCRNPDPDRRIRVGYVSPHFRDHVVGRNLLPLIRERDPAAVEVVCYADVPRSDALTAMFRAAADAWREVSSLDHAGLADLVQRDQIDVLVDCSLHMARGRLPAFALRPAPVQVTFAGYPGTTGMEAIGYRLTDPYLDPAGGETDGDYSERSIRLPHSFWCYDPAAMSETGSADEWRGATPTPPPAISNGFVTFGSLSNFCKVSDGALALWAHVLAAVPRSRLLLLAPPGTPRRRVLDLVRRGNVDPARVDFVDIAPRAAYLAEYGRIDVVLDTIPYNGHTTSLDALWMGVPVVTRVGRTVVGRAGLSQLTNLGLTELVARSDEEYVRMAAELAADLPRLIALRAGLRARMLASPLTDAKRFARGVEAAYRQMWQLWCERQTSPP